MHAQEQQVSLLELIGYKLLWAYVYYHSPYILLRRFLWPSALSLDVDLQRSFTRTFFNSASYQQLRQFALNKNDLSTMIVQSPRFHQYRDQIYQEVTREGFSGYWVIRGSLEKAQDPRNSDIVICYAHGGGLQQDITTPPPFIEPGKEPIDQKPSIIPPTDLADIPFHRPLQTPIQQLIRTRFAKPEPPEELQHRASSSIIIEAHQQTTTERA
ncbi:hypothetical protein B7463_g6046, partial [Scytalidium lignicola]